MLSEFNISDSEVLNVLNLGTTKAMGHHQLFYKGVPQPFINLSAIYLI